MRTGTDVTIFFAKQAKIHALFPSQALLISQGHAMFIYPFSRPLLTPSPHPEAIFFFLFVLPTPAKVYSWAQVTLLG